MKADGPVRDGSARDGPQLHLLTVEGLEEVDPETPDDLSPPIAGWCRTLVLLLQAISAIASALPYFGLSTIATQAARYYGVPVTSINNLAILSQAVPLFLYVPAMALAQKSPQACWMTGVGFTAIGCWMRCIPASWLGVDQTEGMAVGYGSWFTAVFVGQAVLSAANPFVLTLPAPLSRRYFPKSEWALATALATLSQMLGMGLGSGFLPSDVRNLPDTYLIQNVIAMVPVVLVPIVLALAERERAAYDAAEIMASPRASQQQEALETRGFLRAFGAQFCSAITNFAVVRLLIGVGIAIGMGNTLLVVIEQVLPPSVRDQAQNSALYFFGAGCLGAILMSVAVDITQQSAKVGKINACLLVPIYFAACIPWYSQWGTATLIAMPAVSFFVIAVLPVSIETCVDLLGPGSEAIADGLVLVSTNIWGIIILFLTQPTTPAGEPASEARGHIIDVPIRMLPFVWGGFVAVSAVMIISIPNVRRAHAHHHVVAHDAPTTA